MIKRVVKDNFSFVYLNKNFYSLSSIELTIGAYSEFLNSKISDFSEKYNILKIEFLGNGIDKDGLIDEMLNYLISCEMEVSRNGSKKSC